MWPRLEQYCEQRGGRFQAVDLRWGVGSEAAADQQTMNICLGETSRWVLFGAAVDPSRAHTVEVRVLGTPGRPRFDVDAFLVLR